MQSMTEQIIRESVDETCKAITRYVAGEYTKLDAESEQIQARLDELAADNTTIKAGILLAREGIERCLLRIGAIEGIERCLFPVGALERIKIDADLVAHPLESEQRVRKESEQRIAAFRTESEEIRKADEQRMAASLTEFEETLEADIKACLASVLGKRMRTD